VRNGSTTPVIPSGISGWTRRAAPCVCRRASEWGRCVGLPVDPVAVAVSNGRSVSMRGRGHGDPAARPRCPTPLPDPGPHPRPWHSVSWEGTAHSYLHSVPLTRPLPRQQRRTPSTGETGVATGCRRGGAPLAFSCGEASPGGLCPCKSRTAAWRGACLARSSCWSGTPTRTRQGPPQRQCLVSTNPRTCHNTHERGSSSMPCTHKRALTEVRDAHDPERRGSLVRGDAGRGSIVRTGAGRDRRVQADRGLTAYPESK